MARWGQFYYGQAHYDEPEGASPASIPRTHMIDLHRPFINPFDAASISINNLVAFTTDHLGKMNNNNPGGFLAGRITATTAALGTVNTTFQSDLGQLGERKTSKKAKDDYRKSLVAGASKIQLALQNKYGKKSPLLATFFPTGLTKFNAVPDDQVTNAWTTLIAALTAHQAEIGAPVGAQLVTDATALKNGWVAVYTPSEAASGAKDSTRAAKNAARQALQLELFKNWLTIALQFPRQPEQLDVYMQQSLLEPNNPPPPSPTPPPPTPPGP